MSGKALFLTIFLVIMNATLFLGTPVSGQQEKIVYDDGSAEYQWCKIEAGIGDMYAVRFTSPHQHSKIVKFRYYITGSPDSFWAVVFDSERNYIFEKEVKPRSSNAWFNVDTAEENIFVEGDFYIAIEYIVAKKPKIGYDTK